MTECGRKLTICAGVLLLVLSPFSASAQQKHKKRLPTKKDPTMVGNRDINNNQINFYSLEKEVALGQQLAAQIEMQVPLDSDPVMAEYVNRVGQNLALHSDAKVPFTIRVVASEEVNAFALPGGFLYVNMGVIETADTEAELAGVMAHEIAHVTARHALENMSKSQLLSLSSIPLIFVGGPLGDLGRMGAEFGLSAAFFKFSRGAEKEADELAAQYLWASGYDPESLITFFEKLEARQGEVKVSSLFRSHPTTPDRIKNVNKLIAQFPERETYVVNTREFDLIKRGRSGARNVMLGDAGMNAPSDQDRPVLRRRPVDDPSVGETSGTSSSDPVRSTRQQDENQGEPPVLSRRTPDTSSDTEAVPPGREDRSPPRIVRRTSPDSSNNDQIDRDRQGEPEPPTIVRRTMPGAPETEDPSSQSRGSLPPDDPPSVLHRIPSSQDSQPLQRIPPKLRRRF